MPLKARLQAWSTRTTKRETTTLMLPDILTVEELAKLLDCKPETVEQHTRERKLPGVKFGRSWRFPRDAVLLVLHQQAMAHLRPPAPSPAPAPATRWAPISAKPVQLVRGQSPSPLPDPPSA